jgi:hypothetical protein
MRLRYRLTDLGKPFYPLVHWFYAPESWTDGLSDFGFWLIHSPKSNSLITHTLRAKTPWRLNLPINPVRDGFKVLLVL